MALDTYANLQTAVEVWLARPGDALISSSIPDWITLFEADASLRLRTHWQQASYTFNTVAAVSVVTNSTTAAGNAVLHFSSVPSGITAGMNAVDSNANTVIPPTATVLSTTSTTVTLTGNVVGAGVASGDSITFTQATYPLPTDFLEAIEMKISSVTPIGQLNFVAPSMLDVTWDDNILGKPVDYTIEGFNMRLGPTPDTIYSIVLGYWQKIPSLSNTNTTNWLLTNAPQCYLFGTLMESQPFLGSDQEDASFQMWSQRREQAYQRVELADRKFSMGSGPIEMRHDPNMP